MIEYVVTEAIEADIPTLKTIVARSFHPSNEFFRKTFPDTPLIREWWGRIFLDEMQDQNCRVFAVFDTSHHNRHAIGILLLEKGDSSEGLGVFELSRNPPTEDHDIEGYKAMLESATPGFEKHTSGRIHLNIGLLGVDVNYQGQGLGKQLLDRACQVSDSEGIDLFVQANKKASVFYEKRGFSAIEEVVLPNSGGYTEVLLRHAAETPD